MLLLIFFFTKEAAQGNGAAIDGPLLFLAVLRTRILSLPLLFKQIIAKFFQQNSPDAIVDTMNLNRLK